MAQPTGRDLHVDQMLTNISIGYKNTSFIADQIFPIVPVLKRSDLLPKYEQSHWFRALAKRRAPGTKAARGGYNVKHDETYYCHRSSFAKDVFDEDRDNTDKPFDLDRDATEFVTNVIRLTREVDFADANFKTGVWGTDKVGGTDFTQFSDYAGSDPLGVVSDYMDTVEDKTGSVEPNTLVIGKKAYTKLKWHPDLIDLIKYTQKGQITADMMASMFEVERLLIGRATKTTDPEGTSESSISYSRVWGKHILLLYVAPRPSLMNPSAGYTFVWQRVSSAIEYIRRIRDDEREADVIEGNSYYDQKVTGASSGLFMQNASA